MRIFGFYFLPILTRREDVLIAWSIRSFHAEIRSTLLSDLPIVRKVLPHGNRPSYAIQSDFQFVLVSVQSSVSSLFPVQRKHPSPSRVWQDQQRGHCGELEINYDKYQYAEHARFRPSIGPHSVPRLSIDSNSSLDTHCLALLLSTTTSLRMSFSITHV